MSEDCHLKSHFLHIEENFIKSEDSFSNITNPLPENIHLSTDDLDEKPLNCEVVDKNYQLSPLHTGGENCQCKSCSSQPSIQQDKNTLPVPVECECCICREKKLKANFIKSKCCEVSFSNVTNPLPESIHLPTDVMNEKPLKCEVMDKNYQLSPQYTGGEFFECNSCSSQQSSQHGKKKLPVECKCCVCREKNCKVSLNKHVLNGDFKMHLRAHTNEKRLKCEVQDKNLQELSKLVVLKAGEYDLVECELCKRHLYVQHKGEGPFQCELCKKSSVCKRGLTERLLGHSSAPSFQCEFCLKRFYRNCDLNMHLRVHIDEKHLKGEIQDKNLQELNKHVLVQTGEYDVVKCELCEIRFNPKNVQNGDLKMHLRAHAARSAEPSFQCEFCEKRFYRNYDLKTHVLTHTGERPYQCELCEKSFVRSSALKIHLRGHTGEKPFQCEFCEKSFVQRSELKAHLRVNTGKESLKCEWCQKCFHKRCALNTHIRVHLDERPFKCEFCRKSFNKNSRLKSHLWRGCNRQGD